MLGIKSERSAMNGNLHFLTALHSHWKSTMHYLRFQRSPISLAKGKQKIPGRENEDNAKCAIFKEGQGFLQKEARQ